MINGITFSERLITSEDFAHFMYTFLNQANGITKGCGLSHTDGTIYIQNGYFIQHGRMVQILGTEEIASPSVVSGQLYCKVVFEIDLSKTNTAEEFLQGAFKTLYSESGYPKETKEDLDNGGTLYQMPWCQYIKTSSGISNFYDLRSIIDLNSIWSAISEQNLEYKGDFDTYFASQKATIEDMIAELENQGFLLMSKAREIATATFTASGWSSTAPYTQTVLLDGITSYDTPVPLFEDDGSSESESKAKLKAYGYVSHFESGSGSVTATCKYKRPTTDFSVGFKGV